MNSIPKSELPISGNTNVYNLNAVSNITTQGSITIGSTTTFAEYIITSNSTSTWTLASIPTANFRSAIFSIQAYDATSGKFHLTTISAIHNVPYGTTVDFVEYGQVATSGVCGTYSVTYSSGNFVLSVIPVSADSTSFKIFTTLQAI